MTPIRIAHCADVHLGFRRYDRTNHHGVNQREADVALAFRSTITSIIAYQPNVVVIAGDLFHSPRPSNLALVEAYRQLRRLRDSLDPTATVVIIGGNHDTPRSMETGTIFPLLAEIPGVVAAWDDVVTVERPLWGLVLTLVPHNAIYHRKPFAPHLHAHLNVLVIHAAVAGMQRSYEAADGVAPWAGAGDGWDYIAFGDYHVCRQVGPRAWYSGAVEFTSSNPWGELKERPEKGWLGVELNTERCAVRFNDILGDRVLPPLSDVDDAAMNRLIAITAQRALNVGEQQELHDLALRYETRASLEVVDERI